MIVTLYLLYIAVALAAAGLGLYLGIRQMTLRAFFAGIGLRLRRGFAWLWRGITWPLRKQVEASE